MLEGISLGSYLLLVDYTGRLFRDGIGLPVLAELWYGVENSSARERNAERLRRVLSELILWPLTEPAARAPGQTDRVPAFVP